VDFVLPDPGRQAECIQLALRRAEMSPDQIGIVSTHATSTSSGDAQECEALRRVWGQNGCHTLFNNTKSFIGHAMGAAGALELAGNLPAFQDGVCHATINLERLDPQCELPGLVANQPRQAKRIDAILNNSFGMLGINSVVIVRRI
jgi:3-oxoacyl-[acyl-carrier-protein] synthase II